MTARKGSKSPTPSPTGADTRRQAPAHGFKPTGITGPEAWKIMDGEGIDSVSALVKRLKVDGITISRTRLTELLGKVPEYLAKTRPPEAPGPSASVKRVNLLVDELVAVHGGLTSKTYLGLRVALATRLAESLPTVGISKPDDVFRLLEADDKLNQLIHDIRGWEIAKGHSDEASPSDQAPSLLNIMPFKKTG